MFNTKFKIEITYSLNPNTITSYSDIRFKKMMAHVSNAVKRRENFKVYMKFEDFNKCKGAYNMYHPYFEFANYYGDRDKFRFIDHSDFNLNLKYFKNITKYERLFERKINKV